MSTGLDVFDATLQQSNLWLKDIMQALSVNRHHAYRVLRASLHAVRDRIGPENAVHLGAQLPILIRGVYYEGWRPSDTPTKLRHIDDFLEYVNGDAFRGLALDPEKAVRAALKVMAERLDPSEVDKIVNVFPHELRRLWPTG